MMENIFQIISVFHQDSSSAYIILAMMVTIYLTNRRKAKFYIFSSWHVTDPNGDIIDLLNAYKENKVLGIS